MVKGFRAENPEEEEALRAGLEQYNRARRKKEGIKRIALAVKVVVETVIHFFTIAWPIILAVTILVVFNFTRDSDGGTASEEESQMTSTVQGNTDITTDDWQCTEQEIIDFINNYDTSNNELKTALLNRVAQIKEWQDNHGYSATLLITIAFEEGKTAAQIDDFFNEMNEKAAKWQEEGYTTIEQIAEDYVGDESAQEWANNIENKMQETALEAGVIESGEKQTLGDGYNDVYVSKSGKTYRNYKQNIGSYSTKQWCGDSIVKTDGCSLIAVTIILSGYQNREIDPLILAEQYAVKGSGMNIPGALSGNGIYWSQPLGEANNKSTQFTDSEKQKIKDHVATGRPAIIKVVRPSQFTDSTHFMVLLDYNSQTDQFYLSNPYTGNNSYGRTGWVPADIVLYYCTRFYAIK